MQFAGSYKKKTIGIYKTIGFLGSGASAEVHLAIHRQTRELVAIKLLHAYVTLQDIKEREGFLREATVLKQLQYSGIIRVRDFGFDRTRPYFVMDYASHGSLRKRHPAGSILPLETINLYVQQIADALDYAHAIVHCDVKPDNILLAENDRLLLSDFGISKVIHTTLSQTTRGPAGTAEYMAPEQFLGKPEPASDQYALGIMVYEWICGTSPFKGEFLRLMDHHQKDSIPSLQSKKADVPAGVEQVIQKALEKDPQNRYPSAKAFAQAFEQALLASEIISVQQTEANTLEDSDHQSKQQEGEHSVAGKRMLALTFAASHPVQNKGVSKKRVFLILTMALLIALSGGGLYLIKLTIQANSWTTVLQDFRPSCDPASNSTWIIPVEVKSSMETKCLNQGLLITPLYTNITAELDLDRIQGQPYHPSKLDVQVMVRFSNQQDPDTLAGLLIQRQQGQGGYRLWINSTGYWLLQSPDGKGQTRSGSIALRYIASEEVFIIGLKVQHGKLYGSINYENVLEYDNTLDPSLGTIGLGVFAGKTTRSTALFSSFKLSL
jgi:serine/threonine protein kinase